MLHVVRQLQQQTQHVHPSTSKYVNLFKIPVNTGQLHPGVRHAPDIIEPPLVEHLQRKYTVRTTNVEPVCPIEYSNTYLTLLQHGQAHKNIYLGGDHSMAVASALVHHKLNFEYNPGLIWIDAHADINTQHSSITKNTHGMALAYILGLERLPWISKYLNYKNLVYIGLRDLDPFEVKMLDQLNIRSFTSQFVHQHGMEVTFNHALQHLHNCQKIHVSFDVDVTDFIRGTGTPVPGGISLTDTLIAAHKIRHEDKINSIDFVEYNPSLSNHTEDDKVIDLIKHFF